MATESKVSRECQTARFVAAGQSSAFSGQAKVYHAAPRDGERFARAKFFADGSWAPKAGPRAETSLQLVLCRGDEVAFLRQSPLGSTGKPAGGQTPDQPIPPSRPSGRRAIAFRGVEVFQKGETPSPSRAHMRRICSAGAALLTLTRSRTARTNLPAAEGASPSRPLCTTKCRRYRFILDYGVRGALRVGHGREGTTKSVS